MNWELIVFMIFSLVLIPWAIKKYGLKDDVKFQKTLPIGSAKFKAFLVLAGWFVLIVLGLSLVLNLFN